MIRPLLITAAALCAFACAPTPQPNPDPVAERPVDTPQSGFDATRVQTDLETTARERLGEPTVGQALGGNAYIFAKHYVGLAPPPIVQPDGSYKYPDPPFALLVRKDSGWQVATAQGYRPAKPDKAAAIDAILADTAFWSEPAFTQPGCTDAGGSLLMLKSPPHDRIVRQGACGATQRTERLVFLALEA